MTKNRAPRAPCFNSVCFRIISTSACAELPEQENLYPLFQGELLKELLMNPLRAIEREDKPREDEVYIASIQTKAGLPRADDDAVEFPHVLSVPCFPFRHSLLAHTSTYPS